MTWNFDERERRLLEKLKAAREEHRLVTETIAVLRNCHTVLHGMPETGQVVTEPYENSVVYVLNEVDWVLKQIDTLIVKSKENTNNA